MKHSAKIMMWRPRRSGQLPFLGSMEIYQVNYPRNGSWTGRSVRLWVAGQGAARRNGHSIATSCNAALRRQNRAIRPVADSHQMGEHTSYEEFYWNHDVE